MAYPKNEFLDDLDMPLGEAKILLSKISESAKKHCIREAKQNQKARIKYYLDTISDFAFGACAFQIITGLWHSLTDDFSKGIFFIIYGAIIFVIAISMRIYSSRLPR